MLKNVVTIRYNDPDDESYFPYMNGQFVFKNAVVRFSEVKIKH
jgi:3-oxoacyl-[acyl-carrier-protein] synthase-3